MGGQHYRYRQPEQCFTQPNGTINQKMMTWLLTQCVTTDTDLLELYCGIGNFTPRSHNGFATWWRRSSANPRL